MMEILESNGNPGKEIKFTDDKEFNVEFHLLIISLYNTKDKK